jgi:hypothetical protein
VFDAENHDLAKTVVDAVEDTIGPSSGGPDAGQLTAELLPDSMGVVE